MEMFNDEARIPTIFVDSEHDEGVLCYKEFLRDKTDSLATTGITRAPSWRQEPAVQDEASDLDGLRQKLSNAADELDHRHMIMSQAISSYEEQKKKVAMLETQVKLRTRLMEEASERARQADAQADFDKEDEAHLNEVCSRPKIPPPIRSSEWRFTRKITAGSFVHEPGRVLSLRQCDDGIVGRSPAGDDVFSIPDLGSLTQACALKETIADALGTRSDKLSIYDEGQLMDDQDLVLDFSLVTVQQTFGADFHPSGVLCQLLDWEFDCGLNVSDSNRAVGYFAAFWNGAHFADLRRLKWSLTVGENGYHHSTDVRDLHVEIEDGKVMAVGTSVKRGFRPESGPSSISGHWDFLSRGADWNKLYSDEERQVSEQVTHLLWN